MCVAGALCDVTCASRMPKCLPATLLRCAWVWRLAQGDLWPPLYLFIECGVCGGCVNVTQRVVGFSSRASGVLRCVLGCVPLRSACLCCASLRARVCKSSLCRGYGAALCIRFLLSSIIDKSNKESQKETCKWFNVLFISAPEYSGIAR